MGEFLATAKMLGVDRPNRPLRSDLHYLLVIKKGLPLRSLDIISDAVAPADTSFKYRMVPKATLARRKSSQTLSPEQSVVVARVAAIWNDALRIWKSSDEARNFLFRPHPLLEKRTPIDLVLENELGAELVKNVLGRLEYGSAV